MARRVVTAPTGEGVEGAGAFPVVLDAGTQFGRCVVVDLEFAATASPEAIMALLCSKERALAQNMRGARLIAFTGGRIAARLAKNGTAALGTPTLVGPHGAPTATNGIALSISHTLRYAAALVSAEPGRNVGIDIETHEGGDPEDLLAERILSDAEREADCSGDPIPILWRLSLKEAAYKALFPRVGHVPLRSIGVTRSHGGPPGYAVTVGGSEVRVIAQATEFGRHVLSYAGAR